MDKSPAVFSRSALLWRSLRHTARSYWPVLLGVATATAVIAGALLVGDSVRGSLRTMTLERLGQVESAVLAPTFLTEDLATRLDDALPASRVAPAIRLPGTLRNPFTEAVTQVEVVGLDDRAWAMLETTRANLAHTPGDGDRQLMQPRGELIVPNEAAVLAIPMVGPVEARPDDAVPIGPWEEDETGSSPETPQIATSYSLLVELPAAIPRDTLLGDRDEQVVELPVKLDATFSKHHLIDPPDDRTRDARRLLGSGVLFDFRVDPVNTADELVVATPAFGASRFSLNPSQQFPRVVFVDLAWLQDRLDIAAQPASRFNPEPKPGRINTLLVAPDFSVSSPEPRTPPTAETIDAALAEHLSLADVDITLVGYDAAAGDGGTSVQTRSLILPRPIEEAAQKVGRTRSEGSQSVLVYLVNEIRPVGASDDEVNREQSPRRAAYSVLAGLDGVAAGLLERPLTDDEIALNAWLAEDLGVAVGEAIEIDAYPSGSIGDVPAETHRFTVAAVLPMDGLAADPSLTPSVPGITDAESFADWEQPFEMDLDRVTDRDEAYWDEYRAAPKLFLSLPRMRSLFGSRYGQATSVRLPGTTPQELAEPLRAALQPASLGVRAIPIREQQLAAASGTTDFAGLFLGFSFFLIAAAILLVGLMFRLATEQRAGELGLLAALGWTPVRIRRQLVGEGLVVALVGGLLGLGGAIVFARLMLLGLTSWWSGAVGTQLLELHVRPPSLAMGFAIAVVTAAGAMWLAVRRLATLSPRSLLAGQTTDELEPAARGWRWGRIAAGLAIAAAVLLAVMLSGVLDGREAFSGFFVRAIGFFLAGVLLLAAVTAALAGRLQGGTGSGEGTHEGAGFSLSTFSWRNAARARGRSVLTTALIASACFVLIAVAVARRDPTAEAPDVHSGNGGYLLIAESAAPVLFDLNTPAGRRDAGLRLQNADEKLAGVRIESLARRPGDDASCLNLYQARLPTLLGVPDDVLERWADEDRFRFAGTPEAGRWRGLLDDTGRTAATAKAPPTVPVIGDMNTLMYSLKLGVGQTLAIPEELVGDPLGPNRLEVIGMLDSSVFQGVLLLRQSDLQRLFPEVTGARTFLIEAPADLAANDLGTEADRLSAALERGLADYGLDADRVADRIANFLAVQNTYLSTFQTLGGLGLLLGTLGLAAVMLRNIAERRRELSLMRAVGYRPGRLRRLILLENAGLLAWGLLGGSAAALLAMLPHLQSSGADVPWSSLLALLAAVVVVSLAAMLWAVRHASSGSVVAGLRE